MKKLTIYEQLLDQLDRNITVQQIQIGQSWVATILENGQCGIAAKLYEKASTEPENVIRRNPSLKKIAQNILSEDPYLATIALSAINAWNNNVHNINLYNASADDNTFCTEPWDLNHKNIAIIGHMKRTYNWIKNNYTIKNLYMFDLNPSHGDLSAKEEPDLLPLCDYVIITGTTLINHSISDILQWSSNARKILTGPSVPLCPNMTEVDRIHGMVLSDKKGFLAWNPLKKGSPLPYCTSFLTDTWIKDE